LTADLTRIEFVRGYDATIDRIIVRMGDYFVEAEKVAHPYRAGSPP